MQSLMVVLAVMVIFDGLRGPQVSADEPGRRLAVDSLARPVDLGLLVAGNVFCMACPFTLPRTLARRWLPGRPAWPRWLRSKWLAVVLVAFFSGPTKRSPCGTAPG